jgi:ribosomal protein S28E/S33
MVTTINDLIFGPVKIGNVLVLHSSSENDATESHFF